MNLKMGRQTFVDVEIPLLWGDRAVVQDKNSRISIIDLSGTSARIEVLADEPAPGVDFRPSMDGIIILHDGADLYGYNSKEKTLFALGLDLPEVQISALGTRIGKNWFSGNVVQGSAVGIAVQKDGIAVGASLPPKLATLSIQ